MIYAEIYWIKIKCPGGGGGRWDSEFKDQPRLTHDKTPSFQCYTFASLHNAKQINIMYKDMCIKYFLCNFTAT